MKPFQKGKEEQTNNDEMKRDRYRHYTTQIKREIWKGCETILKEKKKSIFAAESIQAIQFAIAGRQPSLGKPNSIQRAKSREREEGGYRRG